MLLLLLAPASLLLVVGAVLAILRWWFSEYQVPGLPRTSGSSLSVLQSRPSEPWWEQQQRLLTARRQRERVAAAADGGGGAQQQLPRRQKHEQQQQQNGDQEQQRARGGLAGGDPMVAIAAGGTRCRVCQLPTTTRCSKCKSAAYCSPNCQRQDWNRGHKYECSRLQHQHAVTAANKVAHAKDKAAAKQQAQLAAVAAQQQQRSGGGAVEQEEDAPIPRQVIFPYEAFLKLMAGGAAAARRRAGPRGLLNVGNSCYANATVQCLLATRPLRAFLDAGVHSAGCRKPPGAWCLLCELQGLCARAADAGGDGALTIRPLLRNIRLVAKGMAYGRQEDTHELFYSVVNAVEAIQLLEAGGKDVYDERSRETTMIHHVYGGYVRQQTTCCSCRAASRRYYSFMDVVLDIPPGTAELEDALALHTREEALDDGGATYQCDACSQRTRAVKSVKFEVAPNCLALCLKRFGLGRFSKINRRVVAGETLSLAPYMAEGAVDQGELGYSLYAVIVHLDHMNSTTYGHYVAYVRAADGRWFLCDDESIVPVSLGKVLAANAYMLFYERDAPKPAPDPSYLRPKPLAAAEAGRLVAGQELSVVSVVGEEEEEAKAAAAASPPRGLVDTAPAAPPAGVGLPMAASAPVPPRMAPAAARVDFGSSGGEEEESQSDGGAAAAATAAAAGAPEPVAARRPPRSSASIARHSVAAPAAGSGAGPSSTAAEQLQERLSRVSTAPAALVRMAGAANSDDSASPSSSSDGEAIASVLLPLGSSPGASPGPSAGTGARPLLIRHGRTDSVGSDSSGDLAMPSPVELLAAARAQAEAAAARAADGGGGGGRGGGGSSGADRSRMSSPFAALAAQAVASGAAAPPPAPATPTQAARREPSAAAAAARGAAPPSSSAGSGDGDGPDAAPANLPPIQASMSLEDPSTLVVRAAVPGVPSSRDVSVTLLPSLLQVAAPGRFQLLELDLPPHLTAGRVVSRVGVKLFKRSGVLRVEMELSEPPPQQQQPEATQGPQQQPEATQGPQQQQGQQQGQRPPRQVLDFWSSGAAPSSVSGDEGAGGDAFGFGATTPRSGASWLGSSRASSEAGESEDGEGPAAGFGGRLGLGLGTGGLGSSLMHVSVSEADLFSYGLRATARAQQVLRRFGQAAATVATGGPARAAADGDD